MAGEPFGPATVRAPAPRAPDGGRGCRMDVMPTLPPPGPVSWPHRVRAVGNAVNLSSALGLAVAVAGRARVRRGPQALLLAEDYRLPLPRAGAFTVGNVVLVPRGTMADLEQTTTRHAGPRGRARLAVLRLPGAAVPAAVRARVRLVVVAHRRRCVRELRSNATPGSLAAAIESGPRPTRGSHGSAGCSPAAVCAMDASGDGRARQNRCHPRTRPGRDQLRLAGSRPGGARCGPSAGWPAAGAAA